MALTISRVSEETLSTYVPQIFNFADGLDLDYRCAIRDTSERRRKETNNKVIGTRPERHVIRRYIRRPGSMVVVAEEDGVLVGYAMFRVDQTGYGGAQWKWLGCAPMEPRARMVTVIQRMANNACARWEWVWGRVDNRIIHNILLNNVAECFEDPNDPDILTYRKPVV